MILDPDVVTVARHFGVPADFLQAICVAEGCTPADPDAILRAVRCSIPTCTDRREALEITCRTATARLFEYTQQSGGTLPFVAYMGASWAPTHAANDPHHLNQFWVTNVIRLWLHIPVPPVLPSRA